MRCKGVVRVGIHEAEDSSFFDRIVGIPTCENVALFQPSSDLVRSGGMPIAEVEIDTVAGGLSQCEG